MSFDSLNMDLTEVEPEKIGKGGGQYFPVGKFHVQINGVEPWKDGSDQTLVQMQCLASTVPGVEGQQHNEYFSMSPKAYSRFLQLAVACRLTTKEYLAECKKKGSKPSINWEAIIGRQCIVATEEEEYKGKMKAKINFNIFDVDDTRYSSVPKNETFLKRFKDSFPLVEPVNGKPQAVTQQTQPATAEGSFDDVFA